jgi:putative tryptophan/tyrosine transport system substrate-binding protein
MLGLLVGGSGMQFGRLRRRDFITLIGGAGAAWPLAARAQQPLSPVIGFLSAASPEAFGPYVAAFRQGLEQVGYVEGRNVAIEFRWARGQYDQLAALASELVGQKVAVIAANGGARVALAAKAATTSIPIVFIFGDGDPVAYGLVRSFNEPGGNVTGMTMIAGVMEPKRLEILRELVPNLRLVSLLANPNNAGVTQDLPNIIGAAGALGIKLEVVKASTENEIDAAFSMVMRERAQALMVMNDVFLQIRRNQITGLCMRHGLPAIYPWREYVEAGGLISYGASIRETYRQNGIYVGQVLKGAHPASLPVQQPTKFEMVVNLTTAKIIGLEVPPSLLIRADETIE